MNYLTLELNNDSDLELVLSFAKRLNISVLNIIKTKNNTQKNPIEWLEKIAQKGGIESITDPIQWQKEIRTDKKIFNRS